ncbi:MAG: hypothetical protein Q7T08_09985 [Devosia sp.]|nr:hypothetical protein [Devosia sp.]
MPDILESRSRKLLSAIATLEPGRKAAPAPKWVHNLVDALIEVHAFGSSDVKVRKAPAWLHDLVDAVWDYFFN